VVRTGFAWDAVDEATFQAHLERWRSCGITVTEVYQGFCKSIYTTDPNGIMVEFCLMTKGLDTEDAAEAASLLEATMPELESPSPVVIHEPLASTAPAR